VVKVVSFKFDDSPRGAVVVDLNVAKPMVSCTCPRLLTACVGWRHSAALQLKVRVGVGVRVRVRAQETKGCLSHHPIASRDT
jgi:hypothetical protein